MRAVLATPILPASLSILFKNETGKLKVLTGIMSTYTISPLYTHLKIVFGENPKTILPEYNCNQDLVF